MRKPWPTNLRIDDGESLWYAIDDKKLEQVKCLNSGKRNRFREKFRAWIEDIFFRRYGKRRAACGAIL